jgi:uncharacterized protein YbjT (DUF2867 family)
MQLVVFGGAGRTGRVVVDAALEAGHPVTALVRRPGAFPSPPEGLRIEPGDAMDAGAVARAAAGADAAICVLGVGDDAPATALSDAFASVVRALEEAGPARLVDLLTVGVLLSKVNPEFAHVTEEHGRNLALLRASGLDWLGVVAPGITDDPATGTVHVEVEHRGPSWEITRPDLARLLVREAVDPEHRHVAVGVSN